MPRRLQRLIVFLKSHARSWWYTPLIALLAAADAFVVVIPTDGLLVSACMLNPRRWIYTVLLVTLGSTMGAWLLAAILENHGLPFLLQIVPGIEQSRAWIWSDQMMDQWGSLALFLVALSPLAQHPAVALAALAGMPLWDIFLLVFAGRLIKYGLWGWIATHTPKLLKRVWGLQGDLKEAGVEEIKDPIKPKPDFSRGT
jgi:membrane protein YqaA with SNARE-associated domain